MDVQSFIFVEPEGKAKHQEQKEVAEHPGCQRPDAYNRKGEFEENEECEAEQLHGQQSCDRYPFLIVENAEVDPEFESEGG